MTQAPPKVESSASKRDRMALDCFEERVIAAECEESSASKRARMAVDWLVEKGISAAELEGVKQQLKDVEEEDILLGIVGRAVSTAFCLPPFVYTAVSTAFCLPRGAGIGSSGIGVGIGIGSSA